MEFRQYIKVSYEAADQNTDGHFVVWLTAAVRMDAWQLGYAGLRPL
jgi:hypothetical protein